MIYRNVAKCRKCGDVIESKHVHDFVTCGCGAISIDGGLDYQRCAGNPRDFLYPVLSKDVEERITIGDNANGLMLHHDRENERLEIFVIIGGVSEYYTLHDQDIFRALGYVPSERGDD